MERGREAQVIDLANLEVGNLRRLALCTQRRRVWQPPEVHCSTGNLIRKSFFSVDVTVDLGDGAPSAGTRVGGASSTALIFRHVPVVTSPASFSVVQVWAAEAIFKSCPASRTARSEWSLE